MTGFQVYLVLMLDGLTVVLFITTVVLACLVFFSGIHVLVENGEPSRFFKRSILLTVISAMLFIAVPTTKQAALIYVLPKIANNQEVGQLPAKLVELANKKLDEMLKTEK